MPSPNINFENIPTSIRKPGKYFEFNTKLAVRTLPGNLQKVLIVGQRIAAGSVAANIITSVFSDADAAGYFGNGSQLHLMCRAAIKANPYLALQAIAMDDAGAGVLAAGTVTLTGPATKAGVLTVKVAGKPVRIAIANTDTATVIAAALAAQIALQPDLPVTAAAAIGVVTLTAKNKGTQGNNIKIEAATTAAGTTAVVAAMAAGATDAVLATELATVFAAGLDIIISAWNDATSLAALKAHLDSVSGPLEQRGAIGVYGHTGSLATATTLAAGVNAGRISGCNFKVPEQPCELAAAYGAVVASEEDPAQPLNLLELAGITAPALADRLSRTEQETALYNGVTPLDAGPGETVQIVRAITTYTLDAQSIPDISLLDLTTIRTLDYVRKACRERISLRFPREKLSERTAPKVKDQLLDVLYKLEELEIVEQVEANVDGVIVERDLQDPNRLDAKIPVDVVNGLHVFAGRIDLLL